MQKLPIAITALSISIPLIFFASRLTSMHVSDSALEQFHSPSLHGSNAFDPRALSELLDLGKKMARKASDGKMSGLTPPRQGQSEEIGLENERDAKRRIEEQTKNTIAARVKEISRPLNIPDNLCDMSIRVPEFEYPHELYMPHFATFCEYGAVLTLAYGSAPRFDMRQFPGEIVKAAGFIVRKQDGTDDFGCYFKWTGESIVLVGVWEAATGFRIKKSGSNIDEKCFGATYRSGLKRIGLEARYLPSNRPSIDDALKEYYASPAHSLQPIDARSMTTATAEFRSRLNKFWNVPAGTRVKLVVRITISPDGYLSQSPELISNDSTTDLNATRDGAVSALVKAQPFDMFSGLNYDSWKTIDVTFDTTAR